jgi:hypothetical protein
LAGVLRISGRIGRRTDHWWEYWQEDVVNGRQARKLLYRKPWLVCR